MFHEETSWKAFRNIKDWRILFKWILGELICEAVKWAEVNQCFIQGCALIINALNLLVVIEESINQPSLHK
jgi:hypothetical protein